MTRATTNRRRTATLLGGLLVLAAVMPAAAEEPATLTRVPSENVCMVNDQDMGKKQIPIEVAGKTYFGCCDMCKQRLAKDEAMRVALDPTTMEEVDKSKAVIGALPDGRVLYFASEETFAQYVAAAKAKDGKGGTSKP